MDEADRERIEYVKWLCNYEIECEDEYEILEAYEEMMLACCDL